MPAGPPCSRSECRGVQVVKGNVNAWRPSAHACATVHREQPLSGCPGVLLRFGPLYTSPAADADRLELGSDSPRIRNPRPTLGGRQESNPQQGTSVERGSALSNAGSGENPATSEVTCSCPTCSQHGSARFGCSKVANQVEAALLALERGDLASVRARLLALLG